MQYNLKVQEKDIYNDKNRTIVKKKYSEIGQIKNLKKY